MAKLVFGDIVVIDEWSIGVVVRKWIGITRETPNQVDVYNRKTNKIETHNEEDIFRYTVRHTRLPDDEWEIQNDSIK